MYRREIAINEMIAEGDSKNKMCEELSIRFSVSPRSIENQYYQILKTIQTMVDENRAELRSKLMLRNDEIYKKAMTKRQFKTALDANAAQAKLGGLYDGKDSDSIQVPEIIIEERVPAPLKVVGDEDSEG